MTGAQAARLQVRSSEARNGLTPHILKTLSKSNAVAVLRFARTAASEPLALQSLFFVLFIYL